MKLKHLLNEMQLLELQDNHLEFDSIDQVKVALDGIGIKDHLQKSGTTLHVFTKSNQRAALLKRIEDLIPGALWDSKPISASSLGHIKLGKFKILAKPEDKQGLMSAGLQNEIFLVNAITKFIEQSDQGKIDIVFSGDKDHIIKGATSIKDVGRELPRGHKADVIIQADKPHHISLKQTNAEYWGRAEGAFGHIGMEKVNQAVDKGLTNLEQQGEVWFLNPSVAWTVPDDLKKLIVFGLDDSIVVKATFKQEDFVFDQDQNRLIISVKKIYSTLSDFSGNSDLFFLVRNDKTRRTKKLLPGLTMSAVSASRVLNKPGVIIVE